MCERKLRVPRRRCARPAASLTSVFTRALSFSSFFSADGQPFLRSLGLRSSGLTVFAASCLRIMLLSSACSPMLLRTVRCNPVYAATGVHCSLFSHAAPKSRTVVMRALSPSSYFHHHLGSVMCRSIGFGVVSSWLSISWDGGFLVFVHVDAGYE